MQKGKVYKGIAIILFALIFIGAVSVGNSGIFKAFTEGNFNFSIFLYMTVFGFVVCVPIYGIGELLELKSCEHCKRSFSTEVFDDNKESSSDGWICKKCAIKNDTLSAFCKNCGEYK